MPSEVIWEEKAKRKRQALNDTIPHEWRLPQSCLDLLKFPLESNKNDLIALDIPRRSEIMTDKELQITEAFDVATLLRKLEQGHLKSTEVTRAFCKRAAIAHQLTNCLTETFFDQAEARARYLDDVKAKGGHVGPLHGLPISIKDTFQVTGIPATLGLVAYLKHRSEKNSPLVDILESMGAILYVKTNVPQTMMTADSHNNVFGRTLNPHNTALTAGGSSGGEGALVAFRGSPLGVGTDAAGSVRIPAMMCGTYGFKPTSNRIPFGGQQYILNPSIQTVKFCAGPLANDFESMEIFMRAVLKARPALYDGQVMDSPWREIAAKAPQRGLRLGLLPIEDLFPLHPPIRCALEKARQKLEDAGHTVVDLTADECYLEEITALGWGGYATVDSAPTTVVDSIEPPVPSRHRMMAELGRWKFKTLPADLHSMDPFKKLATLNTRVFEICDAWSGLWKRHKLDAIVGPGAQGTAVPHDTFGLPPYTSFHNILDYPAIVIPFERADGSYEAEHVIGEQQLGPPYDPEMLHGAPCSIQIFANRMQDEECLAAARVIDDCLKK